MENTISVTFNRIGECEVIAKALETYALHLEDINQNIPKLPKELTYGIASSGYDLSPAIERVWIYHKRIKDVLNANDII